MNFQLSKQIKSKIGNKNLEQTRNDIEQITELIQNYRDTGHKDIIDQILQKIYQLPRVVKGLIIDSNWLQIDKNNIETIDDAQYLNFVFWSICLQRIYKRIEHLKDNKKDYDRDNIETVNNYFQSLKQIVLQSENDVISDITLDTLNPSQQLGQLNNNDQFILTREQIQSLEFIFQKKEKKILLIQTSSGIRKCSLLQQTSERGGFCGFLVQSQKFKEGKSYKWGEPYDFVFESLEYYEEKEKYKDYSEKKSESKDGKNKDKNFQSQMSLKWTRKDSSYRILIKEKNNFQDCQYVYLPDKCAKQVQNYLIYQKLINEKYFTKQSVITLFQTVAKKFKQRISSVCLNYLQKIEELKKKESSTLEQEQNSRLQEPKIKQQIQRDSENNLNELKKDNKDKDKESKIDKKQQMVIQQQRQEQEEKRANSLFRSDGKMLSLSRMDYQQDNQMSQIDFSKVQRLRQEQELQNRNNKQLSIQENLKTFEQNSQFAKMLGDDLINESKYKFESEQVQIEGKAIQVLEVEIFSTSESESALEDLKNSFNLIYQYSCIEGESYKVLQLDKQYQIENSEMDFQRQLDCFYKYKLSNNNAFCITQEIFHKKSENDLDLGDNIFNLEICIKPKSAKEDDENWGIYKLGFNEYLKNVEGNDYWLITQIKNPLDQQGEVHYAFLHLIIFEKEHKSYFEYIQNLKKKEQYFQCPFYNDCVALPYFKPEQIMLVYNLLSVFKYEKNFLNYYRYDEAEYELKTQDQQKSITEFYGDIRTLFYFMYKSQASKSLAYLTFQQQIWLRFEDKLHENNQDDQFIKDFYEMCREGIPFENRFSIWFNNSSLHKNVRDVVHSLNDFSLYIHHLLKYQEEIQQLLKQDWPINIQQMQPEQIQELLNNIMFRNKDKFYKIISEISHLSCIHMVPQMLLDLNKKFKNQLISKVQLSNRYNQIAQIIKDLVLVGILDYDTRQEQQAQKKPGLQQISIIIYHQGLIDIVDKLITLNKKHKPNKYLQEYKIQSDIFWTVYCFYDDCLKYYINSEYKGKQIINDLFILNYCFKNFIEELWNHLDSLYINTDFLFEKAFLSMFANLMSRELLYRIWDIVFLEIFRSKIKGSWILISVAMTILDNLQDILFKANSIDDVRIIIRQKFMTKLFYFQNYCNFETNYDEFIEKMYFWINKIFNHKAENGQDDLFDDKHLTEKIQIQTDYLVQFNTSKKDKNLETIKSNQIICLDEKKESHFQKLKNIPFNVLYEKFQQMQNNLQQIFDEKETPQKFGEFQFIYGVLSNEPLYVNLVFHSFTKKMGESSEIQFIYKTSLDGDKPFVVKDFWSKKKKNKENYIQFKIDRSKFKEQQSLGKITILINESNLEEQSDTNMDRNQKKNKKQYKGYIEVDNLLYDQVVKLNITLQERIIKAHQTYYLPTGYILECSVLVQTCHSYDLIQPQSKRVSFYYFKNIGKRQEEIKYYPFYPNKIFEQELLTNKYKPKIDFYNVDMLNQWKLNSFIPQEIASAIIDKILPQKFNLKEKEQIINSLTQQNQFYLLDLFLICIIYSQESFPSKANLIFKYLNLFERRRNSKNILDITVKSFLIGFYERIKYHFPSHHVIPIENYFKSKAVSQINKVVFIFDQANKQQLDFTNFFKKEVFDKVFEKNLFLNFDLSNPDLLKLLFVQFAKINRNFLHEKKSIDGKLIIDYQQKSFQRQKQIKLTVDEQKQTFVIKKSLLEKQRINMSLKEKKQELFQRLLQQQKYQINFEVYDTYTEQEFVDLLNQMPLVPLLLTVKNSYQELPLAKERDSQNLSINLNLKLQVKIQVDGEFQYQNQSVFVRDLYFKERENNKINQNQKLYLYLPNINCYSRMENIANSILKALVLDNKIRAIIFDRGNGVKIHSENYFKFDYEIFVEEEESNKKIEFPKQDSFYDFKNFKKHRQLSNLMIYQSDSIKIKPQNTKYSVIINVLTQQRNMGEAQNNPIYFCNYKNQNIEEQSVYMPVVHIQKKQDQKYIVKLQSLDTQQFIVKEKDLSCILETEPTDELFVQSFENYN